MRVGSQHIILCILFFILFNFQSEAQTDSTLRHVGENDSLTSYQYSGQLLGVDRWGYITGHNVYTDYGWAEKYEISQNGLIKGAIGHFGGTSTSTTKNAYFNIYGVGVDGLPDKQNVIINQQILHSDLTFDGKPSIVMFDTPDSVRNEFFVSFELPDYAHNILELWTDTIYILNSLDGTREVSDLSEFGRNAVKLHILNPNGKDWHDLNSEMTQIDDNNYALHLALYPIVTFKNAVGINEFVEKSGYKLWQVGPNPAKEEINIRYTIPQKQDVMLSLINMQGKIIKEVNIQSFEGTRELKININSYPAGNYILTMRANGIRLAQQIQIQ